MHSLIRVQEQITRDAGSGASELMVMSMVADRRITDTARALARCAAETGIEAVAHTVDGPARAHLLAAALQLRERRPAHVVLLDQVKREWLAWNDLEP